MTALVTNQDFINLEDEVAAHNYSPLPVVVERAEGIWVSDVEGNRYLDALSGYSALNFGHRHPGLVQAAKDQLDKSTLTSRAFHNDQLGPFCASLAELVGKEMILPMNTGAEAVETALKIARKWGYQVKGVPAGQAEIIVMDGNFHGRTTTIISFSDDPEARDDYGPYTPGFTSVPYGDLAAIQAAITERTVAVLVEPIQGEQGVKIPPAGFLPGLRELCTERNVLMIADEIQAGLGRVGTTLACQYEGVVADIYTLGKALGGGIGMYAATAILAAVTHRERTGEGQHIDCSLLDSQVAVLANQGANWLVGGVTPGRLGNNHPNVVPYRTYPTADGHVIVACGNDGQFRRLCATLGCPELADDARFATNAGRVTNRDELDELLTARLTRHTRDEVVSILEQSAVPCGPINTVPDVFADPHVQARGMQIALTRDDGVSVPGVAFPARLSATPATYRSAPPRLGADTQAVLGEWLDLDAAHIGNLKQQGILS